MWTKSFNIEVIVICFLSFIPWPGPSVFKISCSRESARVVRKIVQSKWLPILEKYQVKLPLECPFHPLRDIFGPQQAAKKQNRPSQWTCGFCGKSFYEENFLDMHFENRHRSNINMAEDAICLADYCDIMRCEVLITHDSTLSFGDSSMMSTDIEVWSETTAYRTALTTSGPRDLAKLPPRSVFIPSQSIGTQNQNKEHTASQKSNEHQNCDKVENTDSVDESGDDKESESEKSEGEEDVDDSDSNTTSPCDDNHLVDSAFPPVDRKQQKISELQKLKANCKSEDLENLKIRCEILVRDCIAGLLVHLSQQDFKEMEEELNRAVCWYLTCDRYWEDGPPEPRSFPWGLVFVLVMVLSLGVCFCYYIIWVLFDSDDQSIPSASTQVTAHSSPTHSRHLSSSTGAMAVYHHQNQLHQTVTHSQTVVGSNLNTHKSFPTNVDSQMAMSSQQAGYSEEYFAPVDFNDLGQSEHYIYVTYPPELKRRLLESCYNRTTRL